MVIQIPGFRVIPRTGVIYVMQKAEKYGYSSTDKEWANLGQGAPETGSLSDKVLRINQLNIEQEENEYAPVGGQQNLRQKIADFYNYFYRQGKHSQYTWENVCVFGGGRIGLTRLAAALGNVNMGHFIPDYTAYEELLSVFKAFIPIPILLDAELRYRVPLDVLEKEITGRGLSVLLKSNPCNPTGQVIMGDQLKEWVRIAKECNCSLIMDEVYSHYIYGSEQENRPLLISAAEYVENVNLDPIIIMNALTKNWRCPGWRLGWIIGPKEIIQVVESAGSFLDGGANHSFQKIALQLLDPEYSLKNAAELQACFQQKRDYMLARLYEIGIQVEAEPQATFYVWANLSNLPAPLNDGFRFFEAGLNEKVITIPGVFFDVNPEKRRHNSRYSQYCRISFGANMHTLKLGLDAIERMIRKYRK